MQIGQCRSISEDTQIVYSKKIIEISHVHFSQFVFWHIVSYWNVSSHPDSSTLLSALPWLFSQLALLLQFEFKTLAFKSFSEGQGLTFHDDQLSSVSKLSIVSMDPVYYKTSLNYLQINCLNSSTI